MMKRILTAIMLLASLCQPVVADHEVFVKLDTKEKRVYNERLGFGYVTFEYTGCTGNNAQVRISVENITQIPPLAILIFRRDIDEQALKRNKPRIEFEKTFPGERGRRIARGCQEGNSLYTIVTPAETDNVFTVNVPLTSARKLSIPFYVARYKPKDLTKKGKDNISYKILEEQVFDFDIEVKGWSEDDDTYVRTRREVDTFVSTLSGAAFCPNKRHKPSLDGQQRRYRQTRDSLMSVIKDIMDDNPGWMSTDAPHVAYAGLMRRLEAADFDGRVKDCGSHGKKPVPDCRPANRCPNCGLSPQQIYHRLDNIYQRLYSGKITRVDATRAAGSLYDCYRKHKSRKDNAYGSKIDNFYNRIMRY